MKVSDRFLRGALLGSAALIFSAADVIPAYAQLEMVIVTARKRQEDVQNVPVSVTAFSAERLTAFNIHSIETVAAATPQFIVARASSGNGADLSIRGIGPNYTSVGIEQSVSVNVDGMYYGQGRILDEGMYDMSSVEVLKGPQALFFGKNATAGVLSLTSNDPGDHFEALGRVGYEFTSQQPSAEMVLSGPVSDDLGVRLAVHYSDMLGGLTLNQMAAMPPQSLTVTDVGVTPNTHTVYTSPVPPQDLPGTRDFGARLTLKYTPASNLTVTLKGSINSLKSNAADWANELFSCQGPGGTSQLFPGAECNRDWKVFSTGLPSALAAANPYMGRKNGRLYENYDSYTFTSLVNYTTPDVAINWMTGYENFLTNMLQKADSTPQMNRGNWTATATVYRAFSTELRAQSTFDSQLNFMGGLYFQTSKLPYLQDLLLNGTAANGFAIDSTAANPQWTDISLRKAGRTNGTTFALFGQLLWDFAPGWELTGGARYTHETKDSTYSLPWVVPSQRAPVGNYVMYDPANPATGFTDNQTFENVSPEVTVSWKPTSDITAYLAYKTGYKSGGFSLSALNTKTTTLAFLAFKPETAAGFEGGVKSTWFENTLRVDLGVYSYTYSNLQVDFFNSAAFANQTFNAGAATTRGVDLDVEWAPEDIHGLTLRGSLNYDNAYYSKFPGAPCYAGEVGAAFGGGCIAANASFPYLHQDLAGVPTALAPQWSESMGADYTGEIGSGLVLGLSGSFRYSSGYIASTFGNRSARQDAYPMLDVSGRLGSDDGVWQVALIGKNLTDEWVTTSAADSVGSGAGTGGSPATAVRADLRGTPQPPRTITLQLTYNY